MTRIALITAAAARDLDDDLPALTAALHEAGADASIVDWHDETVDWPRFDLALLRSTWDYTERPAEFLAWIDRAASATTVANPPAVVRWNSDKHYLADLERANLPIVSSTFVEPGEDPRTALSRFAERCERELSSSRPSARARAMRGATRARSSMRPSSTPAGCSMRTAAYCCSLTSTTSTSPARPR
jgi:O-ureido-D-serine cyclo-ligase